MPSKYSTKSIRRLLYTPASIDFPAPSEVTEASLEVWSKLPSKIRQDPSMVSFQQEHERLHGDEPNEHKFEDIEPMDEDNDSVNSEFITIKVTNEDGEGQTEEKIKDHSKEHLPTSSHQLSNHHSSPSMMSNISTNPQSHSAASSPSTTHHHGHTIKDEILHDTGQHNAPDNPCRKYAKMICLIISWVFIMCLLASTKEKIVPTKQLAVPFDETKSWVFPNQPESGRISIYLEGSFLADAFSNNTTKYLSVYLQSVIQEETPESNITGLSGKREISYHNLTKPWNIPIVDANSIDIAQQIQKHHLFDIGYETFAKLQDQVSRVRLMLSTNIEKHFPLKMSYDVVPLNRDIGVIWAALILIFLYVLIIWEIVHRTFAAMVASTLSIAVLAALGDRPTMSEIVSYIDVETILLLFSMMILVAILTQTGIFDYLAVWVYKITNGKIWWLIHCLCIFTTLISSFLDNVTTVLLMGPITMRLCEVVDINPIPILMAIVIHANIGGTTTPVGDPPNVIITSNSYVLKSEVTFLTFTVHMSVGVILVMIATSIYFRLKYRNINKLRLHEPKEIKELRRNIMVWERTAAAISPYHKDANLVRETLLKKVKVLQHQLKKKMSKGILPHELYTATLGELQKSYPIKNKALLAKSTIVLMFVIILFFVESIPEIHRLSIGWSALLGVILLLIIVDKNDMDEILSRVEWPTLLFFAAMFVLMEAVARLGLIVWIGRITEILILSVSEKYQLAVAIILILWVSAITSAFVDSIPVTAMMVKVVVALTQNTALALPLQPLVWALAFGPCLGGNGTLVGASANVICAGLAEQHGYKLSFVEFFKVGFPIMIVSVLVTTGYLMTAHVLFEWH